MNYFDEKTELFEIYENCETAELSNGFLLRIRYR